MSWNQFQKEFAGRGYSDTAKSKLYNLVKDRVINPRARDESNVGKFSTFREAIRAFNNQDYPPLENPETPRQVRIQQLEVIMNLNRQRRRKYDELKITTDTDKKLALREEIGELSKVINKLKLEIEFEKEIFPEGSWQQFEHEMSGTLWSSTKKSELYERTKNDVLSGKYPNFRVAVHALIFGTNTMRDPLVSKGQEIFKPSELPVYKPSTLVPEIVEQAQEPQKEYVKMPLVYDYQAIKDRLDARLQKMEKRDQDNKDRIEVQKQEWKKMKELSDKVKQKNQQLVKMMSTYMTLLSNKNLNEALLLKKQIDLLQSEIKELKSSGKEIIL
jgi:hypothetical protein